MINGARLPLYSFFLLPPIGQLRADPVDTGQMQPTPMGSVGSSRCGPVGTPAGELPVVLGLAARVRADTASWYSEQSRVWPREQGGGPPWV